MATYKHIFEVECESAFPIDMLRYDGMFPSTESDSYRITNSITREDKKPDTITVVKISTEKTPHYTPGRWQSFRTKITHVATNRLQ